MVFAFCLFEAGPNEDEDQSFDPIHDEGLRSPGLYVVNHSGLTGRHYTLITKHLPLLVVPAQDLV